MKKHEESILLKDIAMTKTLTRTIPGLYSGDAQVLSGVYWKLSQTSMMEISRENSWKFLAANIFS